MTDMALFLKFDSEFKALRSAAEEKGLFSETLGRTYQRAKGGYADEQYALGELYEKLGDIGKAFAWYLRASDQKHGNSEFKIASIITKYGAVSVEDNDGYSSRYENPEPWLERAFDHGNAESAYVLATRELSRPEPDRAAAARWYCASFGKGGRCDHAFVAAYLLETGDREGALVHLLADAEKGNPLSMAKAAELLLEKGDEESALKAVKLIEAAFEKEGDSLGIPMRLILARARDRMGDPERAFEEYERVCESAELIADSEAADAAFQRLGDMAYTGRGCKQNYTKAVEYFDRVKSFTDDVARLHYADCKLRGLGTERSVEGAAALGSPEALYRLAKENPSMEEHYLAKAADKGNTLARFELGKKCYDREQYAEAILHLLPVSREYPEVPYMLGVCLASTGEFEKALSWFNVCAEEGDGEGTYLVGKFALEGIGCPKDERRAAEYFKKAASLGNVNGAYELGMCCKNGVGMAKNPVRAMKLIQAAADNGCAPAMLEMGNAKRLENKEEAMRYYRTAAELGYEGAMYRMGFLYEIGYVTGERDIRSALEWYGKCRKSFKDVKKRIAELTVELSSK